jgi:hypothetical protein
VLTEDLKVGKAPTGDLARVQRKREMPTRIIQTFQNFVQKQVFKRVLSSDKPLVLSPAVRIALRLPFIRTIPALFIGIGPGAAHVH